MAFRRTGAVQAWWRPWLLVGLGAALVRLVFVLALPQMPVISDDLLYDRLAWNLATGHGYSLNPPDPYALFAPGYPLVLAGLYSLFGHSLRVVRVFQALLGAGTCLLVGLVGARIFGRRVGLIAGGLASLYPAFIFYAGLLFSETVFTFILVLLLWVWVRAIDHGKGYWSVGIVAGLATLVRPEMLAFPLLVWFVGGRQRFQSAIWVCLVMGMVILPWTVRNYVAFGRLIPVSTLGLRTVWLASYPGEWLEWHPDRDPYRTVVAGLSGVEADFVLAREGVRNIAQYPGTYLRMSAKRFGSFWIGSHSNSFVALRPSFYQALQARTYGVFAAKLGLLGINLSLLALGAWGALRARPLRGGALAALLLILYKAAVHTLLFATPRYHVPIMPFVLLFSAGGLALVVEQGWGALELARRRDVRVVSA